MKEIHYKLSVFKVFLLLVLLIGCVYQVLDISYLYFQYKTNINVRLVKESVVEMPALTICTNVSQTIRSDYLMNRFNNESHQRLDKWTQTRQLQSFSLREQLLNATISSDQLFNSCSVLKPIGMYRVLINKIN